MAQVQLDQENDEPLSQINVTPFVDVVLVLLVIFMITAPALMKEILEIKLPKTVSSDGSALQTLGVAINRSGQILLNGELVDDEAFALAIRGHLERAPEPSQVKAILSADQEVPYRFVVKAIDLMKTNGLDQFAVQIERQTESGDDQ